MTEYKPTFITGKSFVDDRGTITAVNDFKFENVKRFYTVQNFSPGFIRAFHGHKTGETFVHVITGAIQLITTKMIKDNNKFILDSNYVKVSLADIVPGVYYIPAMYANGFVTLSNDTKIMFFSTTDISNYAEDDVRFPWDYLGVDIWNLKNYR